MPPLRVLLRLLLLLFFCAAARGQTLWEAALPVLPAGQHPAQVGTEHYADAVEALLQNFEVAVGRQLTPGKKARSA